MSADQRIQEALKMFSELEHTAIEDPEDNRRFRTLMGTEGSASASAPSRDSGKKPPTVPPPSAGSTGSSRGSSRGRGEGTKRKGTEDDSREQEVNEAILKQLHKKNQALQAEVARLSKALEQSKPSSSLEGSSSSKSLTQHSSVQEVESLRAQLKQQQNASNAKQSQSAASITSEMDRMELLQLRKQYQDLLGIKIEILERGESTGKVNKEVKDFFVAAKSKLVSDVAARETERALWNERVYQLEVELASMERK